MIFNLTGPGTNKSTYLCKVRSTLHGNERDNNLPLVVTLGFNLNDSDLVLLGSWHQDGAFNQKPMARLDPKGLLFALLLFSLLDAGLGNGGIPGVLFVAPSKRAGPHELFLHIVTSENGSHLYKFRTVGLVSWEKSVDEATRCRDE